MCALIVTPYLVGCDDVLRASECRRAECEERSEQEHEFGRHADDE
jgi:hypothetical protein